MMEQQQGFSLIEVLLSLMLMTMTALTLFEQQWHSMQHFNQIHMFNRALIQLDNASECVLTQDVSLMSGQSALFKLQAKQQDRTTALTLSWQQPDSHSKFKTHHLDRIMVNLP